MITRDARTAVVDRAFAAHASTRWLIGGARDGTGAGGAVGIVDLEPGCRLPLRRTAVAESVVYVLEGPALFVTKGAGSAAGAGSLLYAPAGAWYGVEAPPGSATRLLVAIASAAGDAESIAWEEPDPAVRADRLGGRRPVILDVPATEQVEMHDPAGGRHRIRVRWLLDGDRHGTDRLIVGQCSFGPRSLHERHRHPGAPEALYAYRGAGVHLSESGERRQRSGELVYVPAGEWHGLRGPDSGTFEALFLLFGVNTFDAVGHELYAAPP